jgi:hypothetical protein
MGFRPTPECGYKIVVDLDCIQGEIFRGQAVPPFTNPTSSVTVNPSSLVSSVLPSGSIGRASALAAP